MNPLEALDQETLLDMLTKYYKDYRQMLESNWNQKEYVNYRESLEAIVTELSRRTEAAPVEDFAHEPKHERGNLNEPRA
jgi:hypothetical protein